MTKTKVIIYTIDGCMYCKKAKELLKSKKVEWTEIRVDLSVEKRVEMETLSGRTSVPQIFINNNHIGGCDDLHDLDSNGQLDVLLK